MCRKHLSEVSSTIEYLSVNDTKWKIAVKITSSKPEWCSNWYPVFFLDKIELFGYSVIHSNSNFHQSTWTMYRTLHPSFVIIEMFFIFVDLFLHSFRSLDASRQIRAEKNFYFQGNIFQSEPELVYSWARLVMLFINLVDHLFPPFFFHIEFDLLTVTPVVLFSRDGRNFQVGIEGILNEAEKPLREV